MTYPLCMAGREIMSRVAVSPLGMLGPQKLIDTNWQWLLTDFTATDGVRHGALSA